MIPGKIQANLYREKADQHLLGDMMEEWIKKGHKETLGGDRNV